MKSLFLRISLILLCLLLLMGTISLSSCVSQGDGTNDTNIKGDDEMNFITPEKMGVSSDGITEMVEGLKAAGLSMHSIVVMRHGEIVAEGYAAPFDETSLHRMYSTSKSFVSIAIGVLAEEGKISLDDTIDEYFPDYVNENTDKRIVNSKIVDLLRMASPYITVDSCRGGQEDWVYAFFNGTPDKQPGESFNYDTGASHILGVIVERVTGMDFLEYLKQKALLEIGFSEESWCIKAPEGYAWAGSGVMCTSRDLALFANLVMNKGEYNGKQLLPRGYVEAATTKHMETAAAEGKSPYYGYGYGYQIWINPYGFGFMGMGCQLALCVPDEELVFVCTADNQGISTATGTIYSLFEEHIVKKLSDEPFEDNRESYDNMVQALSAMEIPYQSGDATSDSLSTINGKTYEASVAGAGISSFRFDFSGDEGTLTYNTPRGEKTLSFGIGKNVECLLDEPQYSGDTIGVAGGKGYRALCSGAWKSDTVFVLKVQVVDDYFGNMTFVFNLGATPTLNVTKNAEWFLEEYKMKNISYEKH